jgi:lipopolysaccharide transport system ATP-binding protein
MSDIAIQVENLSKQYIIGTAKIRHDTLRDQLMDGLTSLFRGNGHATPTSNTIWALKDVSFEVKQGEVLGIIGRNGAGKSTLLKILSRITQPTTGRAKVYGRLASLLEVGTGFHPELTGRENIYLNGAVLGMGKAEIDRKLDEIIAFAEIEKFIDTPVKRYSSGMYVRLAFAVAAHLEPEVLVIDEVLAVGDAAFQKKCLGKMEEVRMGGRTLLFVSHNLAMIEKICQQVILLREGAIAKQGDTKQVIEDYVQSLSGQSNLPLARRSDRTGLREIFVTEIQLRDGQGHRIEHGLSGREIILRLHYHSTVKKVFKNCRVSLAVQNGAQHYFLMSTDLVEARPLELSGDGHIDFIIHSLPLSGGNYYLTSYIEAGREIQDWVENAAQITVIDGDFYGTGKNFPDPSWQGVGVMVKHTWRLGSECQRAGKI